MNTKQFLKAAALGVVALVSVAADGNWTTNVVATERGHMVGNPDATLTLVEFLSYTCPHCAEFEIAGDAPLQLGYVSNGKLKLDIRPVIRNEVDLVVTTLAQCGPTEKFLQNHRMFMHQQDSWLGKAKSATAAQMQLWQRGDAAGHRAMASALGLYAMMETRGYTAPQVDKCLADSAAKQKLRDNSEADAAEFNVNSTPSFALNFNLLLGVHTWESLEPALEERFSQIP